MAAVWYGYVADGVAVEGDEACAGVTVRCNRVRSCRGTLRRLQTMAAASVDDDNDEVSWLDDGEK
jgi:hypothetical protein